MNQCLQETKLLNYVHDEIEFGYNIDDNIPASAVLSDGCGQCNTKGTLFMALLRAVGVPCRLHGFTINKRLQKGAMTGLIYSLAPESIVHSRGELEYEGRWYNIEGFILDMPYLRSLQEKFPAGCASFCGYGVATDNFANHQVEWEVNDTYIQKEGIDQDFGLFYSPDEFFSKHQQNISPLKKWIFQHIGHKLMNHNVAKIRVQNKST